MNIDEIINSQNSEEAIEQLEEKNLPIEDVKRLYYAFKHDLKVVGQAAMNLSLRTSVYDKNQGQSEIMTELLIDMSESDDMGSRWAVAKNPHTPVSVLEKLGKDPINLVRALVATNSNTPSNVLNNFFSDEKIVRDGLSGNPNTPVKLLKILADDSDKMVRLRLAENPSATKDILTKLTTDGDPDIAKAATIHLEKNHG
jgi:hypothetical protein